MNTCLHPDCKRSPTKGEHCDRCADWINSDQAAGDCPCVQRTASMSNLIVTDANGKKYKPTGEFREPEYDEPHWCFTCSAVRFHRSFHGWSCHQSGSFRNWAVILKEVPVEYVAHVRLTQERFEALRDCEETSCETAHFYRNQIRNAIRNNDYEEVS